MIWNRLRRRALLPSLLSLVLVTCAHAQGGASPALPDSADAAIRVTLLGTGRPDPAIDRFGPSTLIEAGGETVMIDCGRGATQRLWQLRIPLSRVSNVFLTHLHSDHTVGLPDLWLTGWLPTPYGRRAAPLGVWGPSGTEEMTSALKQAFAWDIDRRGRGEGLPAAGIAFEAHDIDPGVVFERSGVRITAFLVDHGGLLEPAYGYRVDFHGHSVVISGDTRPCDNLVTASAGVDVLVHEVIAVPAALLEQSETVRRIVGFHTPPEDAGRIFARVRPRLAVYTHVILLTTDPAYPAPSVAELLPRTRSTYDGPLEIGEDLMSIEIGREIGVHRWSPPQQPSLAGTWRGSSTCVDKERFPSCNDEEVIYEARLTHTSPDTLAIKADKVVAGARQFMGELFLTPQADASWATEVQTARVHFQLVLRRTGDRLTGVMMDAPSGRTIREIALELVR